MPMPQKDIREEKVTSNIRTPDNQIEALKKYFPHCFDKNGNFDFEKFKKELAKGEVNFSKESYGLDWLGKSYARLLATDEATTLLKEDEEWNKKEENKNSQNLLIKGDNLEVLKHLSNAYYEKIKMIYIDPPYNTGSDGFVYQDDRKFTVEELSKLAGIDEEKAKRILDFVNSKSNSHSAWLTFMYPRLYIARQLLRDDGVIFVSIDDNEIAQLRIMMDEIFGEENFVANICWNSTKSVTNTAIVSENHSYILIYSKNIDWLIRNRTEFRLKENDISGFTNPDNDPNGPWKADPFQVGGWRPNQQYEIVNPKTGKVYRPNPGNSWKNDKKTFEKLMKEGRIVFGVSGEAGPQRKRYLFEALQRGRVAKSLWDEVGTTSNGTNEVKKLFDGKIVFSNPKPVSLIKKITELAMRNFKNDLILDFFAGSGTTGDAVMQLNAEDGGNRKYILVQLPEPIDEKKNKIAYDFVKNELGVKNPTIFEITRERLIRAGKKLKEEIINKKIKEKENEIKRLNEQLQTDEIKEKIKQLEEKIESLKNQDLGFKIFETTPIWEDYKFEAEEFDPQQTLFDESKLTDEDIKTLLTTWKTYDGIPLTEDLKEIDLGGYKGYYFETKLYLMHKGFETKDLKKLLEEIDKNPDFNPATIIAFGYNFESKALREIAENVRNYANKKQIDIDFIIRY